MLKNTIYPLPVFAGEYSDFEGHADKSSKIRLIPNGGILQKDKIRKKEKTDYELFSLAVWRAVLENYLEENHRIISPKPYGTDDQGKIFMEFVSGINGEKVLSHVYDSHDIAFTKEQIRLAITEKLGRLMRIKDIEGLSHGDFQLRHVIYNVNKKILSVIDVENSKICLTQLSSEHHYIKSQINAIFKNSPRLQGHLHDSLETGYYAPIDDYSVLGDIASRIQKDFAFKSKILDIFLGK